MSAPLEPDRNQIEIFTAALFCHAGDDGFVSLRAFYEGDSSKPFRITPISMKGGLAFLNDAAEDDARRAAQDPKKVVFCPPIAVFSNGKRAREIDIAEGLALSVECDTHPQEAHAKLESILGPATVVVRSGGTWTDPQTGEAQDKLHLHWRLQIPARGREAIAKLKQARDIATRLVGGDPSNKPVCHPIRWPGSVHRKAEPTLCSIAAADRRLEINLDTALAALVAAAPKADAPAADQTTAGSQDNAPRSDWAELLAGIVSAKSYHDTTVRLAAKLLRSGMNDGAAVNTLRAWMDLSTGPRDERWQTRFDDIPRSVSTAREEIGQPHAAAELPPLPFINIAAWDNEAVPEQEWSVFNRFPLRQAVLFSGEGAAGKSTIYLHLAAAHALTAAGTVARDWLGSLPEPGPALFVDAEDGDDVMHRRLAAIAKHYGVSFSDLVKGGLRLISLAGRDAVLAVASRSGKIEPTPLFDQLYAAAGDIKPKMIGIASSANVYAGSEIDRSQVQQFMSLLTRLAIVANGTCHLLSHPSLAGINSDTGLSGNTQWHNAVRARCYLKSAKPEAGEEPDSDLRELVFKKNNYGPISESIVLRYQNGLFLPVPGMASLDKVANDAKADDVFLDLLARFARDNRNVSDRTSANYAPALFAREQEAKTAGINSKSLEAAMRRLFQAEKIWNEPCGKPSRPTHRLARKN